MAVSAGARKVYKAEKAMTRMNQQRKGTPRATIDRVVARPDGYYWLADDGEQEFGPFPTAAGALAAAGEAIEIVEEEEQALQNAEAEIGVAERQDRDIVEVDEQGSARGRG